MSNLKSLSYKGYHAAPEYSEDDQVFYGKILGIDDFVDFSSESIDKLEEEFRNAVDDYLNLCQEIGKEPQKPDISMASLSAKTGNSGRQMSPEEQALKDAYEKAKRNLVEVKKHHSKHSKSVARAKGAVRIARVALLDYRRKNGISEFAFRGQREARMKKKENGT